MTAPVKEKSSWSAGSVTTALSIANMLVGLAFQALIAAVLGLGSVGDSFQVAWTILTFGAVTFASLVPSLFVPRLYLEGAERVAIADIIPIAGMGIIFTGCQVSLGVIVGGPLGAMIAFSAPAHVFASVAALAQSIAYIQRRFALAAMGPVANGVALTAIIWFARESISPIKLGMALMAGYAMQAVVALVPFVWNRPHLVWVRSMSIRTLVGVALFTLFAKLQPVIERFLSLMLAEGATAALGFGQKIAQGILMVASFGLALTATAALTGYVSAADNARTATLISRTFLSTFLFSSLCIAGALPLVYIVVNLLFGHGNISHADTVYIADVVILQLPWVAGSALTGVLTNYLYVNRSYIRVLGASLIGIISMAAFTLMFGIWLPELAVAIGSSIAAFMTLFWVWYLVKRTPVSDLLKAELKNHRSIFYSGMVLVGGTLIGYMSARIMYGPESLGTLVISLGTFIVTSVGLSLWGELRNSVRQIMRTKI